MTDDQNYIGEMQPLTAREILLDIQAKVTRVTNTIGEHSIILRGDGDSIGLIERVRTLESTRRVLIWLATVTTVSVLGLLWAIFTNRIDLVVHP